MSEVNSVSKLLSICESLRCGVQRQQKHEQPSPTWWMVTQSLYEVNIYSLWRGDSWMSACSIMALQEALWGLNADIDPRVLDQIQIRVRRRIRAGPFFPEGTVVNAKQKGVIPFPKAKRLLWSARRPSSAWTRFYCRYNCFSKILSNAFIVIAFADHGYERPRESTGALVVNEHNQRNLP